MTGHRILGAVMALFIISPLPVAAVDMSPEESEWLRENPVISLAVDDGNPPVNYRGPDGGMSGIGIELINLAGDKAGLEIRYEGSDWNTAYDKAVEWQTDGIVNATYTEERLRYFQFSDPYFENPLAFAVPAGTGEIRELADMEGWRIAVIANTVRVPLLEEMFDQVDIVEVPTLEDAHSAVVRGQADALFDDMTVVDTFIERFVASNLELGYLYYAGTYGESRIAIRRNAPELVSIINKGIAAISPEERSEIHQRWLKTMRNVYSSRRLELSDEERAWLEANPVITAYTDPGYAPFNFIADGRIQGISVDFLRAVEDALDFEFNLVYDRPWSDGLEDLQNGEIDFMLTVSPRPERESYMSFSDPYLRFTQVLFTQSHHPYITDLSALRNDTIALIPGTAMESFIRSGYPNLMTVEVPDIERALQGLARGEYDLVADNIYVISHYAKAGGLTNLRVSGELPVENILTFGVRSDLPVLLSIINKALEGIGTERRQDILNEWSEIDYRSAIDWVRLYPYIAVLAIVIILVIVWNALLAQEVKRRKEAENELKENHDRLLRSERLSAVGNLVVGLSHEINTPLGIAVTASSHLREGLDSLGADPDAESTDPEDLKEALDLVTSSLDRAVMLVRSLKYLGGEERKSAVTEVEVQPHVAEIIQMHRTRLEQAGCMVDYSCSESLRFRSFQGVFLQVIGNLLENTLDHAFPESWSGTPVIRLTVKRVTNLLSIVYEDNGIGIPSGDETLVFDAFWTTKRGRGSVGLGLNIVHQVVTDLLNGDITVYRPDSGGTGFQILIPELSASPMIS